MNWILIALFAVALYVVLKMIHFRHLKHKVFVIAIILFILFSYITFTNIVRANSINLKTASGIYSAVKVYFSWIVHAFGNLRAITGDAIKMDWFPKNITG